MGRKPQFDREQVLDSVLRAFWLKGYDSIGMNELAELAGVKKPVLYRLFGSKQGALIHSLRSYQELAQQQLSAIFAGALFEKLTLRGTLQRYFDGGVASFTAEDTPPGCLGISCAMTMASLDDETKMIVQEFMDSGYTTLLDAISHFDPPPPCAIEEIARYAHAQIGVFALMAQSGASREVVQTQANLSLKVLFGS